MSTNEGLPAGQIGYVVEDQEGYIWMSSYYGLIRYDGIDIKTYTTEDGLRNNLVYHLYAGDDDRIWLSTEEAGVGYFYEDSVYYPKEFSFLDSLTVTYISQAENGDFWFSTFSQGVFIWDGDSYTNLNEEKGLPSNIAWHTRMDDSGDTWIATQRGLAIYDGDSLRVVDETNGLSGRAAYSFADDIDGSIWISTSKGITKFKDGKWEQITEINGKPLGYIYDVKVDYQGLVWIATERYGMYWYDGEEFTHIDKQNGLSSNYVYTFNKDRSGRIWVATDENGVNIVRDKHIRIYDEATHVDGKSVNVLFEHGKMLWLGTENGITRFSEDGNSTYYKLPDSIASYKEIWDIDSLANGNLLILNSNSRLYEFDGRSFTDFSKEHTIPWVFYNDVLVDGNTIWLASESGLVKYDQEKVTTYDENDGLEDDFISSLYKDHEGSIWAVSEFGINKIVESDSIVSFSFSDGIAGSSLNLITQSPDNDYWIGSNEGFTRVVMDEINKPVRISNYKLEAEFLQEPQFMQFDNEGNLWLGTSGGLHFFSENMLDEQQESEELNGVFMPLQDYGKGMEMNYLASLQDHAGNMWFGSYTNGLIKYEAGFIPKLRNAPDVFIKELIVEGESNRKNILEKVRLQHDQNHLTIKFGAFNYEYPGRVYYEYRLKGFDEDWQIEYGKNEVNYTNLPPGDYEFELRAKSIDSDWGNRASLAAFQIAKPYWETSWFYLFMIFLLVLLIAGVIKIMLVYFEKRKLSLVVDERTSQLMKTLGEKDVLIKEIHHRVKNNLAVVSGLLDLQSWQIQDKQAKAAIQNSKLRIQTMSAIHEKLYRSDDLTNIEFRKFAVELIEQISKSLTSGNRDIEVNIDIDQVELDIHTAIPCGLILNEAVSNSFEHAFQQKKSGEVNISFKNADKNQFELIVQDNGDGIPEHIIQGERNSLGVTLIQSLAEQVGGKAEIINRNGTTIKVNMPKSA
ncbi:two-component regulator propeller domain-containing protein [Gracilimonas mengyeensis]|uniref:two-component regulator propeller domain-containing protein n=1 Tax=Gracilimonas mengyeensis TaxID=1302730 RepID=UPI001157F556|nr:two-component regulator propeller domain-containing protein [Gracilimonas mengyeensis]